MLGAAGRMVDGTLLASFRGTSAPGWLLRRIEGGLGGVCLFGGNVADGEQLAALVARLRSAGDVVVAVDEEGGDVTRLERATGLSTPGNAALGVVDDLDLTERVAATLGSALAELGITLDLAPVLDVNSDPRNPVIGVRSFGSDPGAVARHGAAWVRGLQGAGVAACAKHFPGHGHTDVDSHHDRPVVDADMATLRRRELAPFAAAIAAGVRAVMAAHLVALAIDDRPATVSRRALGGVLRGELGFGGAIVTDALCMGGIGGDGALETTAGGALAAGADLLCLGPDGDEAGLDAAHRAVARALRDGRVTEDRLAEAAAAAARLARAPAPAAGTAPNGSLCADAARRALRVSGRVPAGLRSPLVVELRAEPNVAAGPPTYGVGDALAERDPATVVVSLAEGDPPPAAPGPLVVVARDAGRVAWQQRAIAALASERPDLVLVELGWPGWEPPASAAVIAAHGGSRANCRAVAELLTNGAASG
jgi:beta-N-acetylhexosaminidase